MDFVRDIASNIWVVRIFWTIIVIVISILIYQIISHILTSHEQHRNKFLVGKKSRTFTRMLRSIIRYALIIIDCLIILQIFGIDISSTLAAAGVASVIVAFAIQDALKDIIRGFDIISDNYYNVGDVVRIGDVEGKVLAVGLKTTKLQDINTLSIISIANRDIITAEVLSDMIDIDIPLPYELDLAAAEAVLNDCVKSLKRLESITNAEYRKVSNFSASSMDYRIKVFGEPASRPQIRRDALHTITAVLEKHHVHIPYTQLDLHTKK